jgi:hypothetical protein
VWVDVDGCGGVGRSFEYKQMSSTTCEVRVATGKSAIYPIRVKDVNVQPSI